jgi:hypothetical protein
MAELLCRALSGPIPNDDEKHFEVGKSYHFEEEVCAAIMRGSPGAFEIVSGLVRVGGSDTGQAVIYSEPISADDAALGKGESNADTPSAPVEVDEEAEAEAKRQQVIDDAAAREEAEQAEVARQTAEREAAAPPALEPEPEAAPDPDAAAEERAAVKESLAAMTVVKLREFAKQRKLKVRISGVSRDKLRASIEKAIDDEAEGD